MTKKRMKRNGKNGYFVDGALEVDGGPLLLPAGNVGEKGPLVAEVVRV